MSSTGPAIPLPSAHCTQTARLSAGAGGATPAGRLTGPSRSTRSAVTQIMPTRLSSGPASPSPSAASVVSPPNAKRVTPAHGIPPKPGGGGPARSPMAQPLTSVARMIMPSHFTGSILPEASTPLRDARDLPVPASIRRPMPGFAGIGKDRPGRHRELGCSLLIPANSANQWPIVATASKPRAPSVATASKSQAPSVGGRPVSRRRTAPGPGSWRSRETRGRRATDPRG